MTEWTRVPYPTAAQVARIMEAEEEALPPEQVGTAQHFARLRDGGDANGAVDFLAHALPRFECVAWAARVLDEQSRSRTLPLRDRLALDTALRWVGDPDESHRLATWDAAEQAGARSPERLLALAVFFSGGTLSTPDLPPVNPPPGVCARFAAAAIRAAAYRTEAPQAVLSAALLLGEAIAQRGVAALSDA